ncbi:hypothetical protein M404DRAFT_23696 [Pisolithus tinctorius Marx 270]|uniref:Uncharacterized protein n=1 Tax=Pisolithus tinctorius Marx 270 TaxID=870435 RepID=A0A0C3PFY5_PISTI|nr:hypothetical protein M404DRAFT_23696 [Pisolithus tinctorius Marx 270]
MSTANDLTTQQKAPLMSNISTTSNPTETTPCDLPSCNDHDPSSTPSTDTLPSTSTSVSTGITAAPQLQEASTSQPTNPPDNILHKPTIIPGTISAVGPPPEPCLFDPDRISACPKPLLNSIYDAQDVLKSKSAMEKLDISHLEKRSLVLLETHFNHYRQKDENGRWTITRAQFKLQAIYLLQNPCLPDPEQNIDSRVEITDLTI